MARARRVPAPDGSFVRITALMDMAAIPPDDPLLENAEGEAITERHVVSALRELGHDVSILGAQSSVEDLLDGLKTARPDVVFNLTESFRDNRGFDKNIAALLELLDVPFTGTGPSGLLLCRDKGLCKQLLSLHKIRVPKFVQFPDGAPVRPSKNLPYPMVVKPALADGSEGIAGASLVATEEACVERIRFVHERWRQTAIAEEYIEGRELYVGVLGNGRLTVFPPREIVFGSSDGEGPVLATYRVKWDREYREKWGISFGDAGLEEATQRRVARVCRNVYRILQLRDFGRIDLRLTPDGGIVVLEANPNPDIAYGEEFAEAAENAGVGYAALIGRIVRLALARYARHLSA